MTERKDRDRVIAEITLSHLLRLANEHHCFVSRKQALKFLNQQGHAFEMWKQMMQAGEDFIARSLLGQSTSLKYKSEGVSVHMLGTLLTLTATVLWQQSLAVLKRGPIGLFQLRACRYSKELFSRISRLGVRSSRNTGLSSKKLFQNQKALISSSNNSGGYA
jgi:hypothetical protein